jgi:hypothetical protein
LRCWGLAGRRAVAPFAPFAPQLGTTAVGQLIEGEEQPARVAPLRALAVMRVLSA